MTTGVNTAQAITRTATSPSARFRWRKLAGWLWRKSLALLVMFFALLPIFWLALTSFKNVADVYSTKILVPLTLDNYTAIFTEPLFFQRLALNSLIAASGCVAISLPLGLAAAYVFSRFHFRGSQLLVIGVLVTQFIPPLVIAIPFWTLFHSRALEGLGLANSLPGLIIVYISMVLPYSIWMLRGFVDALPIEVEEAASVDGCNEFQTLRFVTLPLVMPGVLTTLIFSFIMCWNEFTYALLLTSADTQTLQIGLYQSWGYRGVLWEQMAATGMIIMVPMFILSFAIRKYFIEGITMGAVK